MFIGGRGVIKEIWYVLITFATWQVCVCVCVESVHSLIIYVAIDSFIAVHGSLLFHLTWE